MAENAHGSREFWDAAAREDAAWYIATGSAGQDTDFFSQGGQEVDRFLAHCGVSIGPADTVLEIGCGVGRMTHRLAELGGRVLATDVSGEMLARCRHNLAHRDNVEYLQVGGSGSLAPVPDGAVDVVFSYITLQHVPSTTAQLRYLSESARVLRPSGHAALQVRAGGARAMAHDWLGHLAHLVAGRRTLRRQWRGARLGTRAIARTVADAGARLELRPYGHRHLWVVISA